jgi:23S rRNA (uracil-5-)-methyltransferase RumA
MICEHFGICGGCLWQDVPYEEQLSRKQEAVNSVFHQLEVENISPILPSERIFYYRNKMEFAFGKDSLGLKQRKKFDRVVDVKECLLLSETSNKIIETARNWVRENRIEHYDAYTHEGLLRHLVIREGKMTGQILVNLIMNTTRYKYEYELKNVVDLLVSELKSIPQVTCIMLGLNKGKADVARAEDSCILSGDGFIEEKIDNLRFRISPYSFFQTNTYSVSKLYSTVKKFITESGVSSSTAMDVYCGTGSISLYMAGMFEKVVGIEENPSAVSDANINAGVNDIKNCEFVCERAEIFLKKTDFSKSQVKPSTVILDPPRAGLCKKVLNALLELNPDLIVYVSCNTKSIYENLKKLIEFYRVESVQSVDMFPHTPHIETVVKLTRRGCRSESPR